MRALGFEVKKEELKKMITDIDADGSGAIDYKELRAAMKALDIKVPKEELKKMISDVDTDGSGSIEFPEFLEMMTAKMGGGVTDSKEACHKVFKMFDEAGMGRITLACMKKVAKELGENMTEDELTEMLAHAAKGGSNTDYLTLDDFYRFMKKAGKKEGGQLDDLLGDD